MSTQLPESPLSRDERMWAMFTHLSALSQFIGVPLGNVLGPLIIWLIKKEQYSFVDDQGKESLNFQISMLIYAAISGILCLVLIGFVLLGVVLIVDVVFTIIAAVNANDGKVYRYPLSFKFIK